VRSHEVRLDDVDLPLLGREENLLHAFLPSESDGIDPGDRSAGIYEGKRARIPDLRRVPKELMNVSHTLHDH
jgi:hypothetical protein